MKTKKKYLKQIHPVSIQNHCNLVFVEEGKRGRSNSKTFRGQTFGYFRQEYYYIIGERIAI